MKLNEAFNTVGVKRIITLHSLYQLHAGIISVDIQHWVSGVCKVRKLGRKVVVVEVIAVSMGDKQLLKICQIQVIAVHEEQYIRGKIKKNQN